MPKVIGVRFKEAGKIFTFMPTIENLKKGTKVVQDGMCRLSPTRRR